MKKKQLRSLSILMFAFFYLICAFQHANAASYTVTNLNDAGPGSLRKAILDANANPGADVIDATGVTGIILLTTGQPTVTGDLTINGPGANLLDVHNTNGYTDDVNWRVFNIGNVTATFLRLRISGGLLRSAGTNGTGINNAGQLTLTNCIVSGNEISGSVLKDYYGLGAGIYNSGTLAINNSLIDKNSTTNTSSVAQGLSRGAGISNGGMLTINNSAVSGNNAECQGGGIDSFGTMQILNSTISNNVGGCGGGGISQRAAIDRQPWDAGTSISKDDGMDQFR